MTQKLLNKAVLGRFLLLGMTTWLLATVSTLSGQDDADLDEDVYELSPFVIDSTGDEGYSATNTLAGTRLNAKLGDVGASISVATQDFIRDIGADDIETLLTYTGGTESVGAFGNFQNANIRENAGQVREERVNARQQQNTRIRGLARADLTKDLFITDAPFDNYNIERITVSRGANAALFGLGSPGGILDATLKKANFNNRVELRTKHDNWGSERYVLDVNRVIIDEKLALRIVGLDEHKEWEMKGAYEDDVRFYANALFKPTDSTTIRATYTTGDITAARPNTSPPGDYVSSWVEAGKPLYDGVTDRYYSSIADWQAGNPIPLEQSNAIFRGTPYPDIFGGGEMTGNGGMRMNVIFPDPNSPNPGGFNGSPEGMQVRVNNQGGNADGWPGGVTTQWLVPQEMRNIWRQPVGMFPSAQGMAADYASFFARPVITDRGMFDYREVLQALPNKQELGNIEHLNLTLEQTFMEGDLGFEVAYDEQEYRDDFVKYSRLNSVNLDMNLTLADGTPNPNVGRAYIGGNAFAEPEKTTRDSMRATAFYKVDFAEKSDGGWLSKLGRHVLTGSWSKQEINYQQETHMSATSSSEWQAFTEGRTGRNIGGLNRIPFISYVSDSLIDIANPSDFNISGVNVIQRAPDYLTDVIAWDAARAQTVDFGATDRANIQTKLDNMVRGTQQFAVREHMEDRANTWTWGGRGAYSEVNSIVGIIQSHFLNDLLVTTFSWRQDDVEIYNYGTIRQPDGDRLHIGFADIPDEATLEISGKTTTSYSIVGHSPEFINEKLPWGMRFSAHYNDSANFDASSFRTDIFGVEIPQQEGTTKDYGFTVYAFDNKVALKVNFYESEQVGASVNPVGRPNNIWRNILNWNTPEEIAATGIPAPPAGFLEAYEFEKDGSVNEVTVREFATDGAGNTLLDANGNPIVEETIILIDNWTARNPQQNAIETAVGKTESEGMEIELVWNPVKNWRIAANVTRAEAIRTNIALAEQQHMEARLPYWLDPNVGGKLWRAGGRQTITRDESGAIIGLTPNNDNLIYDPVEGALHNDVLGFVNSLNGLTIFDGLPAPELREWRYNIVTNYKFDDTFGDLISRFGVGGAVRWESKSFLGTGLKRDPDTGSLVQDLSQRYDGDSNTRVDLWVTYEQDFDKWGISWKSRLGVSDLTSDEGLIPTSANPDGSFGAYRIEPPTTWSWTNTISF
ncbi:MAG: TonB-dependent receptor plug domain-containing protein [Opitutales bacterium]|nr:TonB-dependent receptor plug domain-containing protein [Opitutales bacterium]